MPKSFKLKKSKNKDIPQGQFMKKLTAGGDMKWINRLNRQRNE